MATALAGCVAAAATIPFVSKKQVPARPDGNSIHELKAKVVVAAGAMAGVKDPDVRLLKLCREWWAQKQKTDALFALLEKTPDDDLKRQEDLATHSDIRGDRMLRRISEIRAHTLPGFAAKMHVLRNCGANSVDDNSAYSDDRLVASVAADSERLFPTGEECLAPPTEGEDAVVAIVREIDRLQARFNELDEMRDADEVYRRREMKHLDDDIRAHHAYLMTLRPRSIEGALLLVGAAFNVESIAWDCGGEALRARSHRQHARALWAVADFLSEEFEIDVDALGLPRLMGKHMNPWRTLEEKLADPAKRMSSQAGPTGN